MSNITNIISKNLQNLMLDRGISIVELSSQSGVSRTEIYNILNDKTVVCVDTLELIRSVLGVGWADLLGDGWQW